MCTKQWFNCSELQRKAATEISLPSSVSFFKRKSEIQQRNIFKYDYKYLTIRILKPRLISDPIRVIFRSSTKFYQIYLCIEFHCDRQILPFQLVFIGLFLALCGNHLRTDKQTDRHTSFNLDITLSTMSKSVFSMSVKIKIGHSTSYHK